MMSSLYISTTGMKSLGEGMASIGNNLANANTVGFKSSMMLYQDLISAPVTASSNFLTNMSQKGLGVSVETNRTMFQQGSFEPGNEPTDMAISGIGFFGVVKDGVTEYTRAGNFRFTKDGDLIDPNGFNLLGNRVINGVVSATVEPIKLDLSPNTGEGFLVHKPTSEVTLIENLGDSTRHNTTTTAPFGGLAASWNGAASPPISKSQAGYVDAISVYDNNGERQTLNAYFDYVGTFDGKKVYEYVIGTDPAAAGNSPGNNANGLFAGGTMTFSSTGELMDMTMFTPPADGNLGNAAGWLPAGFGAEGNPQFTAQFAGATSQAMTVDFGLQLNGAWTNSYSSAADMVANPSGLHTGAARQRSNTSSTAFPGSSASLTQRQDGYADGFLSSLAVDGDGFMTGSYSNGQSQDLYRIPLYSFTSQDNLRREGGNHYSAPAEAGQIVEGFPKTQHFGSLAGQSLEQSNVDMAREFVTMISTQRGFQMNSKVVSTSDQMLQRALELKR